ncbi:choline/ethanolamine kinase [Gottschalkia purinilytica]|uniref:Choline/ethanolamine kinase n=1 Tax=Gottschalkia purinilytica TaxID=1503 RepID=A0A0L0W7P5_GOTPU|nr:phosphotransferase [Gottschalkia purinilytica]KNF07598.1 choline/ethanolamine kinase [Gottschalkia purinilytica]
MHNKIEEKLRNYDKLKLLDLISKSFNSNDITNITYNYTPIVSSKGAATDGVYRVYGKAKVKSITKDWSFILKVLSSTQVGETDICHPLYWKREAIIYDSTLLDTLPSKLKGPKCYSIEKQTDNSIWLWMEELSDDSLWSLDQYSKSAKILGNFNGEYISKKAMPNYPWLTQNGSPRATLHHLSWIKKSIEDKAIWEHPMIRSAFSKSTSKHLIKLWNDSPFLLDKLETLSETFCHLDAFRRNMFFSQDNILTLIDWSYAGKGIIGTDISDLASASFSMFETNLSKPNDLFDIILESYIDGLKDVGWNGSYEKIKFAFYTISALKYGCLLMWLPNISDKTSYKIWEQISKHSMEEYIHQQGILVSYLLSLSDEARKLYEII